MREILFRGKRTDNGEWVEGAFLNDRDGAFYICPAVSDITYGDNGNRRRIGCWYLVESKTVGQYTGIKDRNGKRIFEGDILSERPSMNSVAFVGKVVFNEDAAAFQIVFDTGRAFVLGTYSRSYSVIGNIHDNPELMKGIKEDENHE